MLTVIIVAAGSSHRMGFDKLMAPLNGKPVLYHTVHAFLNLDEVTDVILVTDQDRFNQLAIDSPKLRLIPGGADRHNSVANGIAAVASDCRYIAVHDGARPLISAEQILRTLAAAQKHQAATSARRITETVKRSNNENFATESVCRDNLWLMETPQIFAAQLLRSAYQHIEKSNLLVTDEVSAVEQIGIPTYLVENTTQNLKITYPQDLELANKLINKS